MSLLVSWRGRLADLDRIDELENALAELTISRRGYFSPPHGEGRRRGAWLLLEPGLPQIPLLVAPDGTFAAEQDSPDGWVACDTRWGSAEAHALLVETLDAVREEFAPGLEVRDDGGYWPGRATEPLLAARRAAGLEAAAFDAKALRKAVRTALLNSSEHPRARITESPDGDDLREGTEAEWDAFDRENTRRVLGVGRALESRRLMDELSPEEVVEALRSEGVAISRQFQMEGEEPPSEEEPFGLGVVQLKRARRGLEFAAAAIPACRAAAPTSADRLDAIEAEIRVFFAEVNRRLDDMRRRWKQQSD